MLLEIALSSDASAIAELEYLLFPEVNLNEVSIDTELTLGTGWVIYHRNALAAYLFGRSAEGSPFDILRLGVHPDYQGRGLGSQLLLRALQHPKGAMLTVLKSNQRAIHLYRRFGFTIVGELTHAGAWVMRLSTSSG